MNPMRSRLAATTNPLVLVAVTWALLWAHGAARLETPYADRATPAIAQQEGPAVWEESWSRRHPGCVALVLWPHDEEPAALLTRGPGGLEEVAAGSRAAAVADVVGACR